jgi:hypothetical protein
MILYQGMNIVRLILIINGSGQLVIPEAEIEIRSASFCYAVFYLLFLILMVFAVLDRYILILLVDSRWKMAKFVYALTIALFLLSIVSSTLVSFQFISPGINNFANNPLCGLLDYLVLWYRALPVRQDDFANRSSKFRVYFLVQAPQELLRSISLCFFVTLHVHISYRLLDRLKHELEKSKRRPQVTKPSIEEDENSKPESSIFPDVQISVCSIKQAAGSKRGVDRPGWIIAAD